MEKMVDPGDERTTILGPHPKKWVKGKKQNSNMDISEDPHQLAHNGWLVYPTLGWIMWQANMLTSVTSTNFGLCKGITLVSKIIVHFNSYKDHHTKSWLVDVNLAIWRTWEFKCNVVPLYMAQMAYAEVAMGVNMDWSTISTSLQAQQKSNLHHKIP
jgi:hypothetical protein